MTDVSKELLPCPFCGGKPYRTVSGLIRCDGRQRWQGSVHRPHGEVLMGEDGWNTRAQPAPAPDVVEASVSDATLERLIQAVLNHTDVHVESGELRMHKSAVKAEMVEALSSEAPQG